MRTLPGPLLLLALLLPLRSAAQSWDLATPEGLDPHHTSIEATTFAGRKALRVTLSPEAGRAAAPRPTAQPAASGAGSSAAAPDALEQLVLVRGVELGDGVIEVDLAGEPAPGAQQGARGFVGVAFRVQPDRETYDAFYLRPTNGRAEDQERRNHTAQYVSHPDWTWFRLREETPSRYESYVDIQPAKWIHVKIEIEGERARLFVDGNEQPTLIVNDVKSGAGARGQVALWLGPGTVAHFANLKIAAK
jgi:hypothetical protein